MKFVFRWIFRIVVLAILLGVGLLVFKDAILEELMEQRLAARLGLEVRIDRLEVALLKPTMTIEGLRLYSPAEFGGGAFLDFREVHVEYDRAALARGELRLRLLRVDLEELCLVRAADGRWNFQEIGDRIKARTPPEVRAPMAVSGVDVLNLSVGQVKRIALDPPRSTQIVRLDLRDELFTNLRAPSDYLLAVSRLAWKLGLKSLTGGATNAPPTRAGGV